VSSVLKARCKSYHCVHIFGSRRSCSTASRILAGNGSQIAQRIEVFAKNLGLAFQITDDVLDVTANVEQLGKDVGKDEQRLTFVKLAGVEGARKLSQELIDTSLTAISSLTTACRIQLTPPNSLSSPRPSASPSPAALLAFPNCLRNELCCSFRPSH